MQIFHHAQSLRETLATARAAGKRIGFVPTMGNLHRAHIELVKIAQRNCDLVVASIFVNRLQFGLNEDWDSYPRTYESDTAKLREVGCDYLFYPDEREVYPNGMEAQTRVIVPTITDLLCGATRPGHFEGVTTVVSKLFNIVQPDEAVFGLKDYQQLAVIRRMVEDLCMPVKIVAGEIFRDDDGLAMSSRNGYLTADERPRANQLHKSLGWIRQQIVEGRRDFVALQQEAEAQIVAAGFRVDYITVSEARSLVPAADDDTDLVVLGAMYTSAARLIDNLVVSL